MNDSYKKIKYNQNQFLIFILGPLYFSIYKFYIISFLLFTIEFTLCFLFHNSLFPLGLGMYPIILFYLISRILYLIIANSLLLKLMNIKLKTNILIIKIIYPIIKKLVSLVSFFVLYSLYFSFFFFYNGIKISNNGNILQILIYENNYSCLSFLFLYSLKLYILALTTGFSVCFFSKYFEISSLLITLESLE